jgi:hypothetical protein
MNSRVDTSSGITKPGATLELNSKLCCAPTASSALLLCQSRVRKMLGAEALHGLRKIINANALLGERHAVYFDQGISFKGLGQAVQELEQAYSCKVHVEQDSRRIGGLQVADLAAHSMATMLLEKLAVRGGTPSFLRDGSETDAGGDGAAEGSGAEKQVRLKSHWRSAGCS